MIEVLKDNSRAMLLPVNEAIEVDWVKLVPSPNLWEVIRSSIGSVTCADLQGEWSRQHVLGLTAQTSTHS